MTDPMTDPRLALHPDHLFYSLDKANCVPASLGQGNVGVPKGQLWRSGRRPAENHEGGPEQRADEENGGNLRARQLEGLGVKVAIERQRE